MKNSRNGTEKLHAVKIAHWCQWCNTEFEILASRELLKRLGMGEYCVKCPNCKLDC